MRQKVEKLAVGQTGINLKLNDHDQMQQNLHKHLQTYNGVKTKERLFARLPGLKSRDWDLENAEMPMKAKHLGGGAETMTTMNSRLSHISAQTKEKPDKNLKELPTLKGEQDLTARTNGPGQGTLHNSAIGLITDDKTPVKIAAMKGVQMSIFKSDLPEKY